MNASPQPAPIEGLTVLSDGRGQVVVAVPTSDRDTSRAVFGGFFSAMAAGARKPITGPLASPVQLADLAAELERHRAPVALAKRVA